MMTINIPKTDDLGLGVPVRINGRTTTLRRVGGYLHYEQDGVRNRCRILAVEDLGTMYHYVCASDGQSPEECVIIR